MDIDNFQTGDIILFSGTYFVSDVMEIVIHDKWSHIGIVIKNPDFLFNTQIKNGIYMYESDGVELEDVDTNEKLFGVQLVDLKEKINKYKGTVCYRKLNWNKQSEEIHQVLKVIYNTAFHKAYDWNVIDLLCPLVYKKMGFLSRILFGDVRRTDKFFCSALVAYIYTQLGLMKKDTKWDTIYPKFFATIKELENGASLGDIIVLKSEEK